MEKRFSVEAEIEILKHEISVLKALCGDLRTTMEAQDQKKREAHREKLAREPKTEESQATEICLGRYDCRPHVWERILHSGKNPRLYSQCSVCLEEKIGSSRMLYASDIP